MRPLLIALLLVFSSSQGLAHEYALTSIIGKDITLQLGDHAIAGSVKDQLVFGYQLTGEFGAHLTMRHGRQSYEASFKRQGGGYGGTLKEVLTDGSQRTTTLSLVKIDQAAQQIVILLNGQETPVSITADEFTNGHFINPEYSFNYGGQEIRFKVVKGMACYGLSLNLVAMIASAYLQADHTLPST